MPNGAHDDHPKVSSAASGRISRSTTRPAALYRIWMPSCPSPSLAATRRTLHARSGWRRSNGRCRPRVAARALPGGRPADQIVNLEEVDSTAEVRKRRIDQRRPRGRRVQTLVAISCSRIERTASPRTRSASPYIGDESTNSAFGLNRFHQDLVAEASSSAPASKVTWCPTRSSAPQRGPPRPSLHGPLLVDHQWPGRNCAAITSRSWAVGATSITTWSPGHREADLANRG